MAIHRFDRLKIGLSAFITLAIWGLLVWRHFHAGVPAHHLLNNPELPTVSDWYGGLLLPVLAWGLLSLAGRRVKAADYAGLRSIVVGLVAGTAYGVAMSVTFFSGHESITNSLFFSLLPLALFLPVYRPECLLGFVLGMSVSFGVVLPALFGSLMALVTFVIHRFIGLPLQRLVGLRTGADLRGAK
ncbi:hypothetical protein G4Y73_10730 [Wenzhouxiangella sp. XN201]|uniref:hypothetical protein n=1 Tax=Wenzhouxiangella sp. XN201 TaxID=2710755 RepID=UPI0013C9904F|nr:hypothetical protein [Wenzhouxiangella sp. XN201]NEZ04625.1 hypothetical protein [Wenzhouxiangella sp. XN201]